MVLHTCALCKKVDAVDPRLLACGHVFCFKCVRNHILNAVLTIQKNTLLCPTCQKPTMVKNNRKMFGSKKLSIAMNLENLLPAPPSGDDLRSPPTEPFLSGREFAVTEDQLFANNGGGRSAPTVNPDCDHAPKCWTCGTCRDWFCDQCADKHFEKSPTSGGEHEIYNPLLCLYCSRQKTWHCTDCDRPFCSSCMIDHVDRFKGHRVDKMEGVYYDDPQQLREQNSSPPGARSNGGDPYYSRPPDVDAFADVMPKYPDPNYRPPAYYIPKTAVLENAQRVEESADYDQVFNADFLSSSATSNFPNDVEFVFRLNFGDDRRRLKKICIDGAGQIFATFFNGDSGASMEIHKFEYSTGNYLSKIVAEEGVEIVDIIYDEKNESILTLATKNGFDADSASASVSRFNFLLKYSVYDSTLIDVYDLPSSENFRFLTIDKKSSNNRLYLAADNGLKIYNCDTRRLQVYCSNETLKQPMSDMIGIDSTDKGSAYLLFKNKVNNECSLIAFHSLPIPVPVPLPGPLDNVESFVISRNNVACFANPNMNRILVFHKNDTKEFVLYQSNICYSSPHEGGPCYSWQPSLISIFENQLLIYDSLSNSFYKWNNCI